MVRKWCLCQIFLQISVQMSSSSLLTRLCTIAVHWTYTFWHSGVPKIIYCIYWQSSTKQCIRCFCKTEVYNLVKDPKSEFFITSWVLCRLRSTWSKSMCRYLTCNAHRWKLDNIGIISLSFVSLYILFSHSQMTVTFSHKYFAGDTSVQLVFTQH